MEKLIVAICEDDPSDMEVLRRLLGEYDTEQLLDVRLLPGAEGLWEAPEFQPDIVLMDIQMPRHNGLEAAKLLAQRSTPPAVIFISQNPDFALRGYGLALRYLTKPVKREALFEALDVAISQVISGRMTFEMGEGICMVLLKDIYYMESIGHYVMVNTEKEVFRFRSSLKELWAKLPMATFAAPHKSYLVNLEHIKAATGTEVFLDNGVRIPLSRRKAGEFNEVLYRFLGR